MRAEGRLCSGDADLAEKDGIPPLRLALTQARRSGSLSVDFGNEPTFLTLPKLIPNSARQGELPPLLPDAPDYARGVIGLAYRLRPEATAFEGP
jgi:hypothetical protein